MPAKESFLVRGPTGQMVTVIAHSPRGAVKLYLSKYRTAPGDEVSVKPRGHGEWSFFKIAK